MFSIRSVEEKDIDDLFELSKQANFINLPQDKALITRKVLSSIKSFKGLSEDLANSYYIFVLVDEAKSQVIGTSMIHGQHGTEKEPHFFLKVTYENKFSQTINTGFTHGMLKLGLDADGPTEIGGLILHPDYRNNNVKLGKQLSFVRFLFMAQNITRFKDEIHCELMPPFDKNGNAPLWEAIGRRFMNMNYKDADLLSRSNKEFILSLYPKENIYVTLLPIEARNAIGKVGKDTLPVQRMLESIGFKYIDEIDPFDGGPHYRCKASDILPIKNSQEVLIEESNDDLVIENYLIDIKIKTKTFESIQVRGQVEDNRLKVTSDEMSRISKKIGEQKSFYVIKM
jgi:arginine N-succinyltransferase